MSLKGFENAARELGGLIDTGGLPACWVWDPAGLPATEWVPRRLESGLQRFGYQTFVWRGRTATWTVKETPIAIRAYRGRKALRGFPTVGKAMAYCEDLDRNALR